MDVQTAQLDMRSGFVSGASGVLASSLAWFAAAFVAWRISPEQARWALYVGGMLIYPASILISKICGASGGYGKDNPLAGLAAANTIWMLLCLPLAYVASLVHLEWFFPAMLLIIGGRYLTFEALYGVRLYWVLGLALAGAGIGLGLAKAPPFFGALAGAAIELIFAAILFATHARRTRLAA